MADQIDNDVPGKAWAIDELRVKTDCHVLVCVMFPFHYDSAAASGRISMNKGQFLFQTKIVCWFHFVLFCFLMAALVTAQVLRLPQGGVRGL